MSFFRRIRASWFEAIGGFQWLVTVKWISARHLSQCTVSAISEKAVHATTRVKTCNLQYHHLDHCPVSTTTQNHSNKSDIAVKGARIFAPLK